MVHAVLSALYGQLCFVGWGGVVCIPRGWWGDQQCTSLGPSSQADNDHTAVLRMAVGSFGLFFC